MGKGNIKDNVTDIVDDAIPDNVQDGLDNVKDEVEGWIPDLDIQDKLGDLYDDIQELYEKGYDNLDVKGNYIDPWTDKVLDYADFNVVVPKAKKTFVKGSNKDDLMSGHWEKHKYEGGKGHDRIFTWYGKDTLLGGDGNDHLYADGDDCTMIGGNGKDYFYIEGGGTSLIKDYEKKDVIRVDGYGKGNIKITNKKGDSLIKAGKHTLAKVLDTKLSKGDLQYSGGSNKNIVPDEPFTVEDDHDHEGHDHSGHDHRSVDPADSGSLTDVLLGAA
ncbi:hypothetical protein [Synechococcus sp. CC9616]|uniref:hypothetical protein n=1 Tax=Synechococcus sp. CC9616 TaxID=110663 RepID=UPI0004901DF5|nr:hypothetical protein [Synechococcus sp. CC9616]